MQRAIKLIPEIIAPFKALIVLALLLTIIQLVQEVIHFGIQDTTTVWQGSCSFKGWNESGDVGMLVDCGEHGEDTLTNSSLIRSYLNNPGPLMCELSAADSISCENRPPLEGEEG
jgi:hypothetical protein